MEQPLRITSEKIELSNFKLNKTGYFIALFLMYLLIALPVLAFTLIVSFGGRPAFGLILFSIFMGFGAYFFYRLATWNKYGKENFILDQERNLFIYQPEAKKISYKIIEFKIETLEVSIINSGENVDYQGSKYSTSWLKLDDGVTTIHTNIKSPKMILEELLKKLEEWGISTNLLLDEMKD
nr:hypothetical protein [uncultured Fluviicola sp.]